MRRSVLVAVGFLLVGLLVGALAIYLPLQQQLAAAEEEAGRLRDELEQLRLASRAVVPLVIGAGDNAPEEWTTQTGRVRFPLVSTRGFEYLVEMENLPPAKTFYVFFSPGPINQQRTIQKVGAVTTDEFGRATLAGVVSLPPGQYWTGNFISPIDDPNPPYTHRTWLCFKEAVTFEVVPAS